MGTRAVSGGVWLKQRGQLAWPQDVGAVRKPVYAITDRRASEDYKARVGRVPWTYPEERWGHK